MNSEQERLRQDRDGECRWKDWGPYLSDRQWGTVREDYSASGDAWSYLPHDHARSRAYRWGEDGIAGWSDAGQRLCFALALWNENDPILKERFFGLSNAEGNHGEDVKELYYYLDATPSHCYLKFLYKYPQAAYPYDQLVAQNAARGKEDGEWELLDSGVMDGDRYFDVFLEYARADCDDLLIRITAHNRGSHEAPLHLLPHLWFRNTWSWGEEEQRPHLRPQGQNRVAAHHATLGDYFLHFEAGDVLFTENETNRARLFDEAAMQPPSHAERVKDAFHRHIVEGVPLQSPPGEEDGRITTWIFFPRSCQHFTRHRCFH